MISLLLTALLQAAVEPNSELTRPVERARGSRHLVVVDPGHGGVDRGMKLAVRSGSMLYEADVALAVSRKVRDSLRARGVDVLMTRDRDTLIALDDRGRIANRANASLFLSIHVNAANPRWRNPSGARGFETYFLADAKTEDERRVAEIENEVTRFEVGVEAKPGDPLAFVISDMLQNQFLRESSELAAVVQEQLSAIHPGEDRGVKQAGFRVLVTAHMPAVLIELGFGTNPTEARYLTSARGQGELAGAIARATVRYLAQLDRRRTAGGGR